jgi:fermentation-respiration switch protein FrsA (DUF1100 family)
MQSRLLFLPETPGRELIGTPADLGMNYQPVSLATQDGERLDAWFIPAESATLTLLFFHGNAGNISHRLDSILQFHRLNLNVFIFDYRGYGLSSGTPSERGTYLDAQAAWNHLRKQRNLPATDIVLFGRSMGGPIAAWLATQTSPGALMIESSFTSVPDMAAELYPFLPVRRLSHLQYATRKSVAAASCPVLVIHSRDDEIIPFEHGQRIFEGANEPKRMLEIQGGHNDGFLLSGPRYTAGISDFLRELVRAP